MNAPDPYPLTSDIPNELVASGTAAPVAPRERIGALDALRGVAIAGILTVNLSAFSGWMFMSPAERAAAPWAAANRTVDFLIHVLMEGKFYSIFSLLFGIGFALWLERGAAAVPRFRRRLVGLLVIGLVHHLVWPGDILTLYALLGFLLVPMHRLTDRGLLGAVVVLTLLPVPLRALSVATGGAADLGTPIWLLFAPISNALLGQVVGNPNPFWAGGDWGELLRVNLLGFVLRWGSLLSEGRPFKVLAMFLLGLWVGRHSIPRHLALHRPLLRRVAGWGYAVGLPLNLAAAVIGGTSAGWRGVGAAACAAVGVVPLALAYAATVALAWEGGHRWWLRPFVPIGRMALTNYLAQTLLCIAIFYGVGLGWILQVGPAQWMLLWVLIMTLQAALSALWLGRFRQGPAEWAWRRATYGRLPGGHGPLG